LLRGDDGRIAWQVDEPLLAGWGVYHAIVDERDGTIYAAANHTTYGPTVQRSPDGGRTSRRPRQIGLPEASGLMLNATWHIEPGRPEEPETLYLGGDPGVLFRSEDGAETWEPNRGILEHPTRHPVVPGCRGDVLPLDPARPWRRRADVRRHYLRWNVPLGRRRRDLASS
jgi:hypothetical protein